MAKKLLMTLRGSHQLSQGGGNNKYKKQDNIGQLNKE